MQQNNPFSLNRMFLLYRQAFIENKKELLIYIGGLCGGILLVTSFFILVMDTNMLAGPEQWKNTKYNLIFMFMFVGLGILYNSMAFSGFRSKEKSLTYLMLPVSTSEKFIFELLNKLIFYIVGFPLLAWVLMNLLGFVIHEQAKRLGEGIGLFWWAIDVYDSFCRSESFSEKDINQNTIYSSNYIGGIWTFGVFAIQKA